MFAGAVYFCLGAGLVFLSDYFAHLRHGQPNISLFGLKVFTPHWFVFVRDALTFMLLCFPVIFAYGLLPQVNTFPMYVFEQIEIHLFGGTATFSLLSSVYVLFRNSVAVLALHGICYAALDEVVSRGSGNLDLSFALFSGLLIAVAYHLSRSSSDPVVLWSVMRRIFKKGDCQSWAADTEGKSILETDMVQDRIEMTVVRQDVQYNQGNNLNRRGRLFSEGGTNIELFEVSWSNADGILKICCTKFFSRALCSVVPKIRTVA